jgi:hypothetical protein
MRALTHDCTVVNQLASSWSGHLPQRVELVIRIARAAVEWNEGGYTSEVVTLVGWMSQQGAATVVAASEHPHAKLE